MADIHPSTLTGERLLADCDVQRQRRSGPGGQHRNKVETAIRMTHRPTGITSEACERRSQAANHAMALRRLRVNLALQVRCPPAEAPSELWLSRSRGGSLFINVDHQEFPALLAEALDRLAAEDWDIRAASSRLDCTTSQLIKLLKKAPDALQLLNQHRQQRGLRSLR